jgi:hypothetical protein
MRVDSSATASLIDNEKEQKLIKKRAQNRLSQRCIREKQLVRIQQLERRLSLLEGLGTETPVALNTDLLEENEELRNTIQVMKKKLLSIATMATTAATSVFPENNRAQLDTHGQNPEHHQGPADREMSMAERSYQDARTYSGNCIRNPFFFFGKMSN